MTLKRRDFITLTGLSLLGTIGTQEIKSFLNPPLNSSKVLAVSPPPLLFRFIAIADTGTGTKKQYAVANAMIKSHQESPFKLAILAGDNIYNYGEISKVKQVFEEPYAPLLNTGVKFYACLGNHDIITENGDPQLLYPGFNMNGRYYTFHQDSVQFFALDTNVNADWENQLIWLEETLGQSQAPWKIVFGHYNLYSSGVYGVNPPLIKRLTPLFAKHGVQLYINGHEHHYERTKSIAGTTYLTSGAGASSRPVSSSQWTEFSTSQLCFAAIEVYSDQMIIKAINTQHQEIDRGIVPLKSS